MRKLILLRHAKSSWDDPTLDDHDRPLSRRGRSAAPVIAEWLSHRKHVPDLVLASSSRRTLETVELMRKANSKIPTPMIEGVLYHASPREMKARLAAALDSVGTIMLVGHQPGLGALTRLLSDGCQNRRCHRAFEHFPTAAAAVLELGQRSWSELEFGTARFVDFAKPRELMDA